MAALLMVSPPLVILLAPLPLLFIVARVVVAVAGAVLFAVKDDGVA